MFKKVIAFFISFCFAFEQIGFAQIAGQMDISGRMSSLMGSMVYENYRPVHLRYLSYDQLSNDFKLLLDKGSVKEAKPEVLENTASDLLRHFFVGISLPNDTFWVNLRPDSPKQMIDDELARTDMGKIMLEADLQLKKDTAKYTSPETFEGREYWDKLYKRAEELYGSENVTIPTLTRPWIVPDEIIVREAQGSAYIYKATLKVMLEQDYLKGDAQYSFADEKSKILNEYSSQIIRKTIIPKLTREINSSKRYAPLRQVYYSLILAQWFKKSNKDINSQVARKIDAKDLSKLTSKAKWDKNTYFKAYQKSFKDGEYNIRENRQSAYGQTIRTYFSGGMEFNKISAILDGGTFQAVRNLSRSLLSNLASLVVGADDGKIRISATGLSGKEDGKTGISQTVFQPQKAAAGVSSVEKPQAQKTELTDALILRGAELNSAIDWVIKDPLPHKSKYQLYRQLSKTGSFVFGSYEGYLNERGLEAKRFFDEISARSEESNFNWFGHFGAFKEQLKRIPRIGSEVGDLHLELFVEAFEGMSDDQVQAFCDVGLGSGENFFPSRSVTLSLTQGCSNMCLICGIRGLERPHFGGQMPFPVAVKIMQKLKSATDDIAPYRDSDPLDYYDEASGATIVDIVNAAQKLGFRDISIVTHGTNYNRDKALYIARELNRRVKIGVSVHVYHGDVMGYALDVLDASKNKNELSKRRERIVNKYVEKFVALVEAAQSGKGGEIRVFRQDPILEQILDFSLYAETMKGLGRTPRGLNEHEKKGLDRALTVVRQMQSIQDEVWEKVQKRVNVKPGEVSDFRVLWIGRASQLLKKIGVPEDVISAIQEADKQKSNLSDNAFDPVVETDGSLYVAISEDASRTIRPVGDIFKDYKAQEFKLFVKLLRASAMAKYNSADRFLGPRLEDRVFKQMVFRDIKSFLESKNLVSEGITIDDFEVRQEFAHYIDSFISLSFPQVNNLLSQLKESEELDDAKAQEIYQAVKEMPVPVAVEFYVIFHDPGKFHNLDSVLDINYLTGYKFIYSFARGEDNSALKRDIYQPYTSFTLKGWRAFSRGKPNADVPAASLETTGTAIDADLQLPANPSDKDFADRFSLAITRLGDARKEGDKKGIAKYYFLKRLFYASGSEYKRNPGLLEAKHISSFYAAVINLDSGEEFFNKSNFWSHYTDYQEDYVNQILDEFYSIYASVYNNRGPYYSEINVPRIAGLVIKHMSNTDTIKNAAKWDIRTGEFREALRGGANVEQPIAIVKLNGEYVLLEENLPKINQDITAIEFSNKEDPDKRGWNQYRVRDVMYYKNKPGDKTKAMESANGFYKEDWPQAPSIWTLYARESLREIAAELKAEGYNCVLVSIGGASKGTMIDRTDVDTSLFIQGKENEALRQEIDSRFLDKMKKKGFLEPVKHFNGVLAIEFVAGSVIKELDNGGHERGFLITEPGKQYLFLKQKGQESKAQKLSLNFDNENNQISILKDKSTNYEADFAESTIAAGAEAGGSTLTAQKDGGDIVLKAENWKGGERAERFSRVQDVWGSQNLAASERWAWLDAHLKQLEKLAAKAQTQGLTQEELDLTDAYLAFISAISPQDEKIAAKAVVGLEKMVKTLEGIKDVWLRLEFYNLLGWVSTLAENEAVNRVAREALDKNAVDLYKVIAETKVRTVTSGPYVGSTTPYEFLESTASIFLLEWEHARLSGLREALKMIARSPAFEQKQDLSQVDFEALVNLYLDYYEARKEINVDLMEMIVRAHLASSGKFAWPTRMQEELNNEVTYDDSSPVSVLTAYEKLKGNLGKSGIETDAQSYIDLFSAERIDLVYTPRKVLLELIEKGMVNKENYSLIVEVLKQFSQVNLGAGIEDPRLEKLREIFEMPIVKDNFYVTLELLRTMGKAFIYHGKSHDSAEALEKFSNLLRLYSKRKFPDQGARDAFLKSGLGLLAQLYERSSANEKLYDITSGAVTLVMEFSFNDTVIEYLLKKHNELTHLLLQTIIQNCSPQEMREDIRIISDIMRDSGSLFEEDGKEDLLVFIKEQLQDGPGEISFRLKVMQTFFLPHFQVLKNKNLYKSLKNSVAQYISSATPIKERLAHFINVISAKSGSVDKVFSILAPVLKNESPEAIRVLFELAKDVSDQSPGYNRMLEEIGSALGQLSSKHIAEGLGIPDMLAIRLQANRSTNASFIRILSDPVQRSDLIFLYEYLGKKSEGFEIRDSVIQCLEANGKAISALRKAVESNKDGVATLFLMLLNDQSIEQFEREVLLRQAPASLISRTLKVNIKLARYLQSSSQKYFTHFLKIFSSQRDILNQISYNLNREKTLHPTEMRLGEDEKGSLFEFLLDIAAADAEQATNKLGQVKAAFDAYFYNHPDQYRIDLQSVSELLGHLDDLQAFERAIEAIRENPKKSLEEIMGALRGKVEDEFLQQKMIWLLENLFVLQDTILLLKPLVQKLGVTGGDVARLKEVLQNLQQSKQAADLIVIAQTYSLDIRDVVKLKVESLDQLAKEDLLVSLLLGVDSVAGLEERQRLFEELLVLFESQPQPSQNRIYLQILFSLSQETNVVLNILEGLHKEGKFKLSLKKALAGRFLCEESAAMRALVEQALEYFQLASSNQDKFLRKDAAGKIKTLLATRQKPARVSLAKVKDTTALEQLAGWTEKLGGIIDVLSAQLELPAPVAQIPHIFFEALAKVTYDSAKPYESIRDLIQRINADPQFREQTAHLKNDLYTALRNFSNLEYDQKKSVLIALLRHTEGLFGQRQDKAYDTQGFYTELMRLLDQYSRIIEAYVQARENLAQVQSNQRSESEAALLRVNERIMSKAELLLKALLEENKVDENKLKELMDTLSDIQTERMFTQFANKLPDIQSQPENLQKLRVFATSNPSARWQDHQGKDIFKLITAYLNTIQEKEIYAVIFEALMAECDGKFLEWKYKSSGYREMLKNVYLAAVESLSPEEQQAYKESFKQAEGATISEKLDHIEGYEQIKQAIARIRLWEEDIREDAVMNIRGNQQKTTAAFTGDFLDLFTIGHSEHFFACQDCAYGNNLNRGLTGYLVNGVNKAIALYDEKGRVITRRIVKLRYLSKENEKPFLAIVVEESTQFGIEGIDKLYKVLEKVSAKTGLPVVVSRYRPADTTRVNEGVQEEYYFHESQDRSLWGYSDMAGSILPGHQFAGLYNLPGPKEPNKIESFIVGPFTMLRKEVPGQAELKDGGEFEKDTMSLPPVLDEVKARRASKVDLNRLPAGTKVHYNIAGGHWDYTLRVESNGKVSIWLRKDQGRIIAPIQDVGTADYRTKPNGIFEEGKSAYVPYFHQTPFGKGEGRILERIGLEGFISAPEDIQVEITDDAAIPEGAVNFLTDKEIAKEKIMGLRKQMVTYASGFALAGIPRFRLENMQEYLQDRLEEKMAELFLDKQVSDEIFSKIKEFQVTMQKTEPSEALLTIKQFEDGILAMLENGDVAQKDGGTLTLGGGKAVTMGLKRGEILRLRVNEDELEFNQHQDGSLFFVATNKQGFEPNHLPQGKTGTYFEQSGIKIQYGLVGENLLISNQSDSPIVIKWEKVLRSESQKDLSGESAYDQYKEQLNSLLGKQDAQSLDQAESALMGAIMATAKLDLQRRAEKLRDLQEFIDSKNIFDMGIVRNINIYYDLIELYTALYTEASEAIFKEGGYGIKEEFAEHYKDDAMKLKWLHQLEIVSPQSLTADIASLLEISKLAAAGSGLKQESLDRAGLEDLLDRVKKHNQGWIDLLPQGSGMEFDIGQLPQDIVIKTFPVVFEGVIRELIRNATKQSVPNKPNKILIRLWVENGRLQVSVKDEGNGFPKGTNPLVDAEGTRSAQGETGFPSTLKGLELLRYFIEDVLNFNNEPNKKYFNAKNNQEGPGSTFDFSMPVENNRQFSPADSRTMLKKITESILHDLNNAFTIFIPIAEMFKMFEPKNELEERLFKTLTFMGQAINGVKQVTGKLQTFLFMDAQEALSRALAYARTPGRSSDLFRNEFDRDPQDPMLIVAQYFYRNISAEEVAKALSAVGALRPDQAKQFEARLQEEGRERLNYRVSLPHGKPEHANTGWINFAAALERVLEFEQLWEFKGEEKIHEFVYQTKEGARTIHLPESVKAKAIAWFEESPDAERTGKFITFQDGSTVEIIDFKPTASLAFDTRYMVWDEKIGDKWVNRPYAAMQALKKAAETIFAKLGYSNIDWNKYEGDLPFILQKEIFDLTKQDYVPLELIKEMKAKYNGKEYALYDETMAAALEELRSQHEKKGAEGKKGKRIEIPAHSHVENSQFPNGPSPGESLDPVLSFLYSIQRPGALIFFGMKEAEVMDYTVYDSASPATPLEESPLNNPKIAALAEKLKKDREVAQKDGGTNERWTPGVEAGVKALADLVLVAATDRARGQNSSGKKIEVPELLSFVERRLGIDIEDFLTYDQKMRDTLSTTDPLYKKILTEEMLGALKDNEQYYIDEIMKYFRSVNFELLVAQTMVNNSQRLAGRKQEVDSGFKRIPSQGAEAALKDGGIGDLDDVWEKLSFQEKQDLKRLFYGVDAGEIRNMKNGLVITVEKEDGKGNVVEKKVRLDFEFPQSSKNEADKNKKNKGVIKVTVFKEGTEVVEKEYSLNAEYADGLGRVRLGNTYFRGDNKDVTDNLQKHIADALGVDKTIFNNFDVEVGGYIVYDSRTGKYRFVVDESIENHFNIRVLNGKAKDFAAAVRVTSRPNIDDRYEKIVAEWHFHPAGDERISFGDMGVIINRTKKSGQMTPEIIVTIKEKNSLFGQDIIEARQAGVSAPTMLVLMRYSLTDLPGATAEANRLYSANGINVSGEDMDNVIPKYFLRQAIVAPGRGIRISRQSRLGGIYVVSDKINKEGIEPEILGEVYSINRSISGNKMSNIIWIAPDKEKYSSDMDRELLGQLAKIYENEMIRKELNAEGSAADMVKANFVVIGNRVYDGSFNFNSREGLENRINERRLAGDRDTIADQKAKDALFDELTEIRDAKANAGRDNQPSGNLKDGGSQSTFNLLKVSQLIGKAEVVPYEGKIGLFFNNGELFAEVQVGDKRELNIAVFPNQPAKDSERLFINNAFDLLEAAARIAVYGYTVKNDKATDREAILGILREHAEKSMKVVLAQKSIKVNGVRLDVNAAGDLVLPKEEKDGGKATELTPAQRINVWVNFTKAIRKIGEDGTVEYEKLPPLVTKKFSSKEEEEQYKRDLDEEYAYLVKLRREILNIQEINEKDESAKDGGVQVDVNVLKNELAELESDLKRINQMPTSFQAREDSRFLRQQAIIGRIEENKAMIAAMEINKQRRAASAMEYDGGKPADGAIPITSDKGGIDFRGLPIVNQPGVMPAGINQLPLVNIADLDKEWRQIEKMAQSEMVPSTQRLKEFLGACCSKGALDKYAGNVLACIADIMRLEEEKAQATEPALREILILLESNRPESDLQQSLSFITVTAGQPQA